MFYFRHTLLAEVKTCRNSAEIIELCCDGSSNGCWEEWKRRSLCFWHSCRINHLPVEVNEHTHTKCREVCECGQRSVCRHTASALFAGACCFVCKFIILHFVHLRGVESIPWTSPCGWLEESAAGLRLVLWNRRTHVGSEWQETVQQAGRTLCLFLMSSDVVMFLMIVFMLTGVSHWNHFKRNFLRVRFSDVLVTKRLNVENRHRLESKFGKPCFSPPPCSSTLSLGTASPPRPPPPPPQSDPAEAVGGAPG